jgi:hypothetical protein
MNRNRLIYLVAALVALTAVSSLAAAAPDSRRAAVKSPPHATAQAAVVGQRVAVRGKPFFPVMLIDQCGAGDAARAHQLGINLIINESCPGISSDAQLQRLKGSTLGVLPIARRDARGRGLAGWSFPDEPEGNGWTPDRLEQEHPYARGSNDGLLSFLTTGPGFFHAPYTHAVAAPAVYGRYARLADIAGFDLYPLGHCSTDLGAVYDAQVAFQRLAGAMPTFQWIETGPIKPTYCGGFQMQPAELRAEVWLAVAGGARGIGYFTHTWSPEHASFDVSANLQHELARVNSLLAAVKPALVGTTVPSAVDTTAVKVIARRSGGSLYVIAVNASRSPINAKIHVPGLATRAVSVFGERRTVAAGDARFSDAFRPLAVHVYVQALR